MVGRPGPFFVCTGITERKFAPLCKYLKGDCQTDAVGLVLTSDIEKYIAGAFGHMAMYSRSLYCYALLGSSSSPTAMRLEWSTIQSLQSKDFGIRAFARLYLS